MVLERFFKELTDFTCKVSIISKMAEKFKMVNFEFSPVKVRPFVKMGETPIWLLFCVCSKYISHMYVGISCPCLSIRMIKIKPFQDGDRQFSSCIISVNFQPILKFECFLVPSCNGFSTKNFKL
jgi:predicted nucleic acid-binding Zn finger protein